jgi:hypothetical protein
MVGRRSPQSPPISRLTLQPETIPSCYRRSRHTEFQPHSGRHLPRMTETETSLTAANDLAIRRPWSWPASSPSTRMAAGRAPGSANLSGQNNPNKKQRPEIALERGDQPEGGFGVRQAADQDAALASRKRMKL